MAFYPAVPTLGSITPPLPVADGGTGLSGAGGQLPWVPSDQGLLIATGDPEIAVATTTLTAGTVYLRKITPRTAMTLTDIWLCLTTAGSGTSTGSFVGLYSSAGTLLSGSADQASAFTGSTGGISCALSAPQALTPGSFYWVAVLSNLGTTQPTFARSSVPGVQENINLIAATFRTAINGTLVTALPSPSITPSSNVQAGSSPLWIGGS
jgi:hypothetical protein